MNIMLKTWVIHNHHKTKRTSQYAVTKKKRKPNETVKVKIERLELQDSENGTVTQCRICLNVCGNNQSIYGCEKDISEDIVSMGGIDLHPSDPYPKNICKPCYTLLKSAVLFRKTAQKSDNILKQNIEQETILDCMMLDDGIDETEINDEIQSKQQVNKDEASNSEEKVKKSYDCIVCDLIFTSKAEYMRHNRQKHQENPMEDHKKVRVNCKLCNKLVFASYMKKHLKLFHDSKKCVCDICGKEVSSLHLTKHRMIHFREFPYKCAICPYKGRFKQYLTLHMRSHTGEKPYQCEKCPKRCSTKSNLIKHSNIHRTDFDYKCDICGKGYNIKQFLQNHIKTAHTDIRNHVCNICGKSFAVRKQLLKHEIKVHKREKFKYNRMPAYLQAEAENSHDPS